MGASCWVYYVPYQEQMEQAFQALRQHLFKTGDYVKQETYFPPPQTIEDVLRRSEGSGTHTAMDIERLSTRPRDYSLVPLPAEILHRFLVEPTPTRPLVEALVLLAEKDIFQQIPWSGSQLDWESFLYRNRDLAEETRAFLESGPSKQDLIEALLTQEKIWRDVHRIIRTEIGSRTNDYRVGDMMPLSPEELVSFFGTEKPTRAAFEAVLDEFWDQLPRWTGFYAVLYQDETPHEIAFVGVSGD